jgi:hypothetical protein
VSSAPDSLSRRAGRSPAWAIGLFLVLYFLTRGPSLGVLPVFLDEAVHLQWAERLLGEGRILRPVGSGRLLAVAAYGLALPFEDRLQAARLIASLAGAFTLVVAMVIARRLFGPRASAITGVLYIVSPFALVYDRLALSDGFLAACLAGVMLCVTMLAERPETPAVRLAAAAFIVLAILSKVSALLFLLTVPIGVLALSARRSAAFRSAALAGAAGLALALPMLWFFARNSGEISSQHFLDPSVAGSVIGNTVRDMCGWMVSYFTPPALILAVASVALLRDGRAVWLGASVFLPFVLFALVSQPWSARYVLPTLVPFLILVAGGIDRMASLGPARFAGPAAFALTLFAAVSGLSFDRDLLTDPSRAPFPEDDRRQLITGWPSGYGVQELSSRLRQEAAAGDLTAWIDTGGTRTLPTSLSMLLGRHPAIRLVEGDLGSETVRARMVEQAGARRVFAILGPRPQDLDLKVLMTTATVDRLAVYQRPGGEWAGTLFRIRLPGVAAER